MKIQATQEIQETQTTQDTQDTQAASWLYRGMTIIEAQRFVKRLNRITMLLLAITVSMSAVDLLAHARGWLLVQLFAGFIALMGLLGVISSSFLAATIHQEVVRQMARQREQELTEALVWDAVRDFVEVNDPGED